MFGLSGCNGHRFALEDELQPVRRCPAEGAIGRADPDDGERNLNCFETQLHTASAATLEKLYLLLRGTPGGSSSQRPLPLVLVDGAGGAEHEPFGLPAVEEELPGSLRIRLDAVPPILHALGRGGMEDIREVVGKIRKIGGRDVQLERMDTGFDQLLPAGGVENRPAPSTLFRPAERTAMGNAISSHRHRRRGSLPSSTTTTLVSRASRDPCAARASRECREDSPESATMLRPKTYSRTRLPKPMSRRVRVARYRVGRSWPCQDAAMPALVGTPSDDVPAILATWPDRHHDHLRLNVGSPPAGPRCRVDRMARVAR